MSLLLGLVPSLLSSVPAQADHHHGGSNQGQKPLQAKGHKHTHFPTVQQAGISQTGALDSAAATTSTETNGASAGKAPLPGNGTASRTPASEADSTVPAASRSIFSANEESSNSIEGDIKRERALDVAYRHVIAKQMMSKWNPKLRGYVAYLLELSKSGQVLKCDLSASNGDTAAADKAIKGCKFPPLPRGLDGITYSIDFKGTRVISIAQYVVVKSKDEAKVSVNLNDSTLEVSERRPGAPPGRGAEIILGDKLNATITGADQTSPVAGTMNTGSEAASTNVTGVVANTATNTATPSTAQTAATQSTTNQAPANQSMVAQPATNQLPATLNTGKQAVGGQPATSQSPATAHSIATQSAAAQSTAAQSSAAQSSAAQSSAAQSAEAQSSTSTVAPQILLDYRDAISQRIPSFLSSNQDLNAWEVATTFRIKTDGAIATQNLVKSSGSDKIDASVFHAVELAAPIKTIPAAALAEFRVHVSLKTASSLAAGVTSGSSSAAPLAMASGSGQATAKFPGKSNASATTGANTAATPECSVELISW